jgi:hypothetical protein
MSFGCHLLEINIVFMIKLFNTMIQSRDKNPSHDKHVANVLGDLHTDLTSFLDLITFIQQ